MKPFSRSLILRAVAGICRTRYLAQTRPVFTVTMQTWPERAAGRRSFCFHTIRMAFGANRRAGGRREVVVGAPALLPSPQPTNTIGAARTSPAQPATMSGRARRTAELKMHSSDLDSGTHAADSYCGGPDRCSMVKPARLRLSVDERVTPTPQTVSRKTTSAGNTTSQIVNATTDKIAAAVT